MGDCVGAETADKLKCWVAHPSELDLKLTCPRTASRSPPLCPAPPSTHLSKPEPGVKPNPSPPPPLSSHCSLPPSWLPRCRASPRGGRGLLRLGECVRIASPPSVV